MTKTERYTEEDILLLMDKMDAMFVMGKSTFNFRTNFERARLQHTLKQSVKKMLALYYWDNALKTQMGAIFKSSIEDMPLLINDPLKGIAVIARWRLEINK